MYMYGIYFPGDADEKQVEPESPSALESTPLEATPVVSTVPPTNEASDTESEDMGIGSAIDIDEIPLEGDYSPCIKPQHLTGAT